MVSSVESAWDLDTSRRFLTLIKWFPDRPGLATGMAIMGFGGGAMVGSPLAIQLMAHFRSAQDTGVGKTFLVMGSLYFLLMMFGVFTIRVPRDGWKLENWTPSVKPQALITTHNVDVDTAFRTKQFWLLWIVLCTNVTAGIGILEQASPMIQELFKGTIGPLAAGGFVGLLSLFNMAGQVFVVYRFRLPWTKTDVLCVLRFGRDTLFCSAAHRRGPPQ